jgi:site-specific recombinase XerC
VTPKCGATSTSPIWHDCRRHPNALTGLQSIVFPNAADYSLRTRDEGGQSSIGKRNPKAHEGVVPRPFTGKERDRIFSLELSQDDQVIRALLYFGGLRVSEVRGLRLGDITLGTLEDPGSMRILGKGRKERIVPIASGLFPTLRDYVLTRSSLDPRTSC